MSLDPNDLVGLLLNVMKSSMLKLLLGDRSDLIKKQDVCQLIHTH